MSEINYTQKSENKDNNLLFDWKEEINNILNGKRDGLLIKSGSVRGYIENLAKSLELEDYKSQFKSALKEIVRSWEVHEPREKEYLVIMLELIASYTPDGYYRKVSKFLKHWENSISKIEDKFGYDSNADLLQKIIETLGTEFNLAPEQESSEEEKTNFRHYLDLLDKYLAEPELSGYIAVILLESFFVEMDNKRIRKAIETETESLYNIMSYGFSNDRKHKLKENLENLAHHVFEVGGDAILLFEERLKVYDADFVYGQSNLILSLSNEEEIAINFSGKAYENFIWKKMNLHLLPEYIDKLFNYSVKENHLKIQSLLFNCYQTSESAVLQFRKALDSINVKIEPDLLTDLLVWLCMEKSRISLLCKAEYKDVWLDKYEKEDYMNLPHTNAG